MKIGAIILAAGASSRLGEPKQLLKFKGKTLLRRAVETAIVSNCHPVVVVLGANAEKVKDQISDLSVETIVCENWADGIGASIKSGMTKMLEIAPNSAAILILLCDQPFVTTETIARLTTTFQAAKKPVAACEYQNTSGVPALFAREMFDELLKLSGDTGAKSLFRKHADKLAKISAPEAAFDVDTRQDYEKLSMITRDS